MGQNELFTDLILQFHEETHELEDMSDYKSLLDTIVEFILGIVEEKGMESLFSLGDSSLLVDTNTTSEDFELIEQTRKIKIERKV